ncbi:MAG: hypothetical protein IT470_07640, partial [Pseudomonadales bacterium]|nr:hypothetical protein [Pseudomonadales bacterium]
MAIEPSHYARTLVFKDTNSERHGFNRRMRICLVMVVVLTIVLLARYYQLQIVSHEHFTTQSDANRIHAMAIPPARGVIQDLEGVVLAQSKPSFTLEIIKERVQDMDYTLRELQQLLQLDNS